MFSMRSELTPRVGIPDTRIPQLMQPCLLVRPQEKSDHLNMGRYALQIIRPTYI